MSDSASPLHIHSPLIYSPALSALAGHPVVCKLDAIQPSGSFKIRGIGYLIQKRVQDKTKPKLEKLVSSSGGNAGMATVYAAGKLGIPVTVVVPRTTSERVRSKLVAGGAVVIVHGAVWDEADVESRRIVAERPDVTLHVPPFDHSDLWDGHSSICDELAKDWTSIHKHIGISEECAPPLALLLSVGGGGLLLGTCKGLEKNGWNKVPIIASETEGAASLAAMIEAQRPVKLQEIKTIATTLGALQVATPCLEWSHRRSILSFVCSDKDAIDAVRLFADEHRMLVEPACGAALAALKSNDLKKLVEDQSKSGKKGPIIVIVCGGSNVSCEQIISWTNQFA